MWSATYSCYILMKFVFRFSKNSNIRFNENPFSGRRAVSWGRTDGHDEDISRFLQFVNVTKNGNLVRTNHYEARRTLSALREIHKEWYLLEWRILADLFVIREAGRKCLSQREKECAMWNSEQWHVSKNAVCCYLPLPKSHLAQTLHNQFVLRDSAPSMALLWP